MALVSLLERLLLVNQCRFSGLKVYADLLDLGPGSPSDGPILAMPSWGVSEEQGIKMLHGITTLALASATQTLKGIRSRGPPSL
uniref:Uncharacterized protein n=1 Tax=Piliocolobus tephrosceles TaxID=591936 RepID=A0A8C9I483_9PRIM